ncbi:MAG: 30S ribosome-binding factor RbfA [Actinomycetota bacterium]|nr:30S ribosome-binding factor RbfA [Actinomycetota bacterium]
MSRPDSPRMRKINELLKEVIADAVTDLKDPGIGFVTITGVNASPDLRNAFVYYSVLGSEEEVEATGAALTRAAPHLQGVVGRQVHMKYTPKLTFRIDPSIGEGIKIDRLLHELETEDEGPDVSN